jgi:hypothetical protein
MKRKGLFWLPALKFPVQDPLGLVAFRAEVRQHITAEEPERTKSFTS